MYRQISNRYSLNAGFQPPELLRVLQAYAQLQYEDSKCATRGTGFEFEFKLVGTAFYPPIALPPADASMQSLSRACWTSMPRPACPFPLALPPLAQPLLASPCLPCGMLACPCSHCLAHAGRHRGALREEDTVQPRQRTPRPPPHQPAAALVHRATAQVSVCISQLQVPPPPYLPHRYTALRHNCLASECLHQPVAALAYKGIAQVSVVDQPAAVAFTLLACCTDSCIMAQASITSARRCTGPSNSSASECKKS